ncbi:MAG: TIGR02270 family protein [Gammaproteobacteria bacterium]|nr:TIGR02270 family protein [Gammaproteobacteria bacterium]
MNAVRTTAEPYWELVEQSFEEAAFFWKRWETDLESPARSLDEVWFWTEDRLHGALDGVRVAGEKVVEATDAALRGKDPAAITAAAHVLAAQTTAHAREALATAVRGAKGALLQAMTRGMETAALDASFATVTAVLASAGPEHSAALCRIKRFRRVSPGREATDALQSGIAHLQAEALRSLTYSADESAAARHICAGLESGDGEVRCAAILTGIRRGDPAAWQAAVQLAEERNADCGPLLPSLAALGSPEEQELVIRVLREPSLQRVGLFALAYIGTPQAVEICLAGMKDEKLARSAGEAYCAITGAELARDGLAAPEPAEGPSPPRLQDDKLDANLVPTAADQWPLPDLDAVRRHWQGIQRQYGPGVRHWRGRPAGLETLVAAVERGPMFRRDDLALELAVRTGGKYDVETRAFADVQRSMMQAARTRAALPPVR